MGSVVPCGLRVRAWRRARLGHDHDGRARQIRGGDDPRSDRFVAVGVDGKLVRAVPAFKDYAYMLEDICNAMELTGGA